MNLRRSIEAALLAAGLLLGGTAAVADNRAAEALNFEFGLKARDVDTSDSTSSGELGARAAVTVPLGNLFALSASGSYAESTVRTRDVLDRSGATVGVRPSCGFDNLEGSVGLFARRPTLGKIGVAYGVSQLSADCGEASRFIGSDDDSLDADRYRAEAEVYFGDFTLGGSHTSTDLDGSTERLETNEVRASWYPFDSLKVTALGNDLYDQDTYGLELEHQPEFMGDALGVYLGYTRTDQEPRISVVRLGFSYYFGTRVSLKVRDRQYR